MRFLAKLASIPRMSWVSLLIFGIGTVATACATQWVLLNEHTKAAAEFSHEVQKLRRETERRMKLFEYGLYGARGLFAASVSVERDEFRAYADSRRLLSEFNGALGYGYVERVPAAKISQFEAELRAQGSVGYKIQNPCFDQENWVIKFLEPEAPNKGALGLEVGSSAVRREALERAMDTGLPALSGRMQLVQDHRALAGFIYTLPVYRKGMPLETVAERRAATQGWIAAPLVIDDVLIGAIHASDRRMDLELFEGSEAVHSALFFDCDKHLQGFDGALIMAMADPARKFRRAEAIVVGGRTWTMVASSMPGEFTADASQAFLVAAIGLLGSGLLSLTFWSISRSRSRALILAEQMTAGFQQSEQRAREATMAAERSLAELAIHKHALDEHAVVAATDISGRILYANDKFCQLSKYRREELLGQNHRLVNSGHHPRQFWIDMWRTVSRGNIWQGEVCNRAKDGSLYWVDTTIVPFRDSDGRVAQYVAIRTDITERKRAQSELDVARQHLQAVLDSATEVSIIATDEQGIITEFSRGAEKMLGYTAAEVVGKCSPGIFHDAAETDHRAAQLTQILERPISGFEIFVALPRLNQTERREWTYITKTGERKTVELAVTAQHNAEGKIFGFLGTATDITSRKQVEVELREYVDKLQDAKIHIEEKTCELQFQAEELKHQRERADAANLAKSQFLANMSHEIRTPLTAILGYADLLGEAEGQCEGLSQGEIITTIRNAGEHLLTIINDILDLSKIEAGKLELEKVPTSLPQILKDVHRLLHRHARDKGVDLRVLLKSPIPASIISDPTRLRQILMNLTGNSVKFTESGSVTLAVNYRRSRTGNWLVVDVEDTGLGMTADKADQLFRPFTQADTSITRKYGGTGLGLTISRRLGEAMGGTVTLVRTAPGEGSCFRLEIPCEPTESARFVASLAETISESPAHASLTQLQGSILFAEDGPDNQRLIALLLRRAGAQVQVADNGQIALEMYEQAKAAGRPYDLLVTDMQMPVMDGYTLARTVRARNQHIPIVALTANNMAEDHARCLEAGCTEFASKPIDKPSLLSICGKLLRGYHQSADAVVGGVYTEVAAHLPS